MVDSGIERIIGMLGAHCHVSPRKILDDLKAIESSMLNPLVSSSRITSDVGIFLWEFSVYCVHLV